MKKHYIVFAVVVALFAAAMAAAGASLFHGKILDEFAWLFVAAVLLRCVDWVGITIKAARAATGEVA